MNSADWWAKKMGSQQPQGLPTQAPSLPPVTAPSQQPMQVMPTFQNTATPSSASALAQSARLVDNCPDCGSGNYFSASPQTAKRCYDCGYPVQQSGSRFGALAGAVSEGAAKQALGNDTSGTYNPQTIIGRA